MVGGQEKIAELWKEWRIKLYVVSLLFGVGAFLFFGLQFGMDFRGGTLIQLSLDKPVDTSTMSTMVTVLSERLNGMGLKDISVNPFGTKYITVEVSASDPSTVDELKTLLSKQGSFEAVIDGQVVLYSNDITGVITNPQQGYGYMSSTQKWQVPFKLSKAGSERFAKVAKGKCNGTECGRIYMFIDRPENAAIVVPSSLYDDESSMQIDYNNPGSYPIDIKEFEKDTLTPIFVADNITSNLTASLSNYSKIIVPAGAYPKGAFGNLTVDEKPNATAGYWLWSAVGLKSVLFLTPGVTSGEPVREATITGGASDLKEALKDMTEIVVILRSGRLPVGLKIASTNSVSPTLGENFLSDSVLMGIIAIFAVAAVIFAYYRDVKVTVLMVIAGASEVLIILGTTALIHQQLDIAGVAGIIASVGTGVDQFIIITDEVKNGEKAEIQESIVARIKRAFKIIMASAATVTAAMLPLMTLGLGLLKGFAITTLIGLVVGVFIVRPAFGKALEKLD